MKIKKCMYSWMCHYQINWLTAILTCGLLFSGGVIFGQDTLANTGDVLDAKYANLTVLDPTESNFQVYTLTKLKGNTGTVNYSIPLFENYSNQIPIPLSLNYSYSGLKTSSISSRYGLGWNLTANAVISRIVDGIKDFTYTFSGIPNHTNVVYYTGWFCSGSNTSDSIVDTGPDKFVISGQINGTFLFDRQLHSGTVWEGTLPVSEQATPIPLNNEGYRIEFTADTESIGSYIDQSGNLVSQSEENKDFTSFTIIDRFGNRFCFNKYNSVHRDLKHEYSGGTWVDSYPPYANSSITSWNLTKMVKYSTNDTIQFEYEEMHNIMYKQRIAINFDSTVTRCYPRMLVDQALTDNQTSYNGISHVITTADRMKDQLLKHIIFKGGSLEFNYQARLDLPGDSLLSSIELLDTNNRVVQKEVFYHSYFTNSNHPDDPLYLRLRLDSISVFDGNNYKGNTYKFTYNEAGENPCRLSDNTDFLGYYKKIDTVGVTTPSAICDNTLPASGDNPRIYSPICYFYPDLGTNAFLPFKLNGYGGPEITIPGVNRDASGSTTEYGSLESISLPTGGKVKFSYQLNDFMLYGYKLNGAGICLKEQQLLDDQGNILRDQSYQYDTINQANNDTVSMGSLIGIPHYVLPIYGLPYPWDNDPVSASYVNSITVKRNYNLSGYELTGGGQVRYCQIKIIDKNGGYTIEKFDPSLNGADTEVASRSQSSDYLPNNDTCSVYIRNPLYYYSNYPFLYNYFLGDGWKMKSLEFYNDSSRLLKQVIYQYQYLGLDSITNIRYAVHPIPFSNHDGYYTLSSYYNIHIGNKLPVQQKTILWDASGGKRSTVTQYVYNSINQLSSTTINTANEDSVEIMNGRSSATSYLYENPQMNMSSHGSLTGLIWKKVSSYLENGYAYDIASKEYSYTDSTNNHLLVNKEVIKDENNNAFKSYQYQYNANNRITDVYDSVSGHKSAYLWDSKNRIIAKVSNATSKEIYFNNFEESKDFVTSTTQYAYDSHSGKYCAKLNNGQFAVAHNFKISDLTSGEYIFSAWIKTYGQATIDVKDIADNQPYLKIDVPNTNGKWKYCELEVNFNDPSFAGCTTVGCGVWNSGSDPVYVDDVRFAPADAQMTTYTYGPMGKVTSVTDSRGEATNYTYDTFGRLYQVLDNNKKVLKQYEYHYKNQ